MKASDVQPFNLIHQVWLKRANYSVYYKKIC